MPPQNPSRGSKTTGIKRIEGIEGIEAGWTLESPVAACDACRVCARMDVDAEWMDIEALSTVEVLPEETLRRIAKGPLTRLTLECDDFG